MFFPRKPGAGKPTGGDTKLIGGRVGGTPGYKTMEVKTLLLVVNKLWLET